MKFATIRRSISIVAVSGLLVTGAAAQSLADYAKQQKQQKDVQPQASVTPKLYTNEDISTGTHAQPASTPAPGKTNDAELKAKNDKFKQRAQQLTQKIRQQKQVVHALDLQIDQLQAALQSAGGTSVGTAQTVQYNQRQRAARDQIARLQQKLGDEKRKLEDMQESARKEGYGTAVYDPS
jgi:predicted RNase H-like nuclease (RuvC/YqgF family)